MTGQPASRTPTPAPTPAPKTYTVVAGDTLSKIASRFDTTVAALVELNNIADSSRIEVGQILLLPLDPDIEASGGSEYRYFLEQLEGGASCQALFDARSGIDSKSTGYGDANNDLRAIGCYSAGSERQNDERPPGVTISIRDYRISYLQCSTEAEEIYAQAGTRDPRRAAEWLSGGLVVGPLREGSTAGCLDALQGLPSRYPR